MKLFLASILVSSSLIVPNAAPARANSFCDSVVTNLTNDLREVNRSNEYFEDVMRRSQYNGATSRELIQLQQYVERKPGIIKGIVSKYESDMSKCSDYAGPFFPALKEEFAANQLFDAQFMMWLGSRF